MEKETDYKSPKAPADTEALGNPTNPISYTRIPNYAFRLETITRTLAYPFSRLMQKTDQNTVVDNDAHSYTCFKCNDIYERPDDFLWHIQTCDGKE